MKRVQRVAGPVALVVFALLAIIAALAYGGAASAPALLDPGPVVRWGLPVANLFVNLSAAGMIGALVMACFALGSGKAEYERALDVAAASAAIMTVSSAVTGILTYLDVTGSPIGFDQAFSDGIGQFATQIAIGQVWLAITLIAAVTTVLSFAVRNQTALVFVTAIALCSLVPMALSGHAAGTAGHDQAITSLGLHLAFAAIWVGGLLTLVLIRKALGKDRLVPVLERFSTLAIICFVVVAFSGIINADLRIGTLNNLLTAYGVLVLVKVLALVVLGLFGMVQRRYLIERLKRHASRGPFWWMVAAELAFMGIASGVAAALARTATPVAQTAVSQPTPAEVLTGEPLPAPLTLARYIFGVNVDPLWLIGCCFALFFYFAAVWRLHRRGDKWPVGRTIAWVAGILSLLWVTNGGINVYEKYLFSSHMLAHMLLTMAIPLMLVPGAPVTLALRAIHKRTDGSRGLREWILLAVHSRFSRFITHPIVTAVLFAGSLWVFYYSPLFRWATTDHIGHEWMITHFLITGYLFVLSLIGIDPVPYRLPYPLRLVLLLATMAFHAFFGLSILTADGLFLADWFGAMGRTWGATPMADQQLAGGIAWSIGEIPTLVLAIAVAVQWSRSDDKETKRRDRQADRSGDAELAAYNAMLQRMASGGSAGDATVGGGVDAAEAVSSAAARGDRDGTARDSRAAKEPQR
ncbi:cytochrome c oxidase assembly protein [Humibacter ginsenosidimutans]|uniref:Copper transporter n=1 Tax=Humibacter ginsenosidimutans TaxID=2599293 RepID=A0A5B8M4A7_9MICO|nr:cytochrome c oxidase assembly protein [Humibacter ginsenosidimutans]QDZ15407.1 copper transporter [Humibacter ginsenosidimutans]